MSSLTFAVSWRFATQSGTSRPRCSDRGLVAAVAAAREGGWGVVAVVFLSQDPVLQRFVKEIIDDSFYA